MTEYTFSKSSISDYKENNSSFHMIEEPSSSMDHIKSKLLKVKEQFSDASHICYAYRIQHSGRLDEYF